MWYHISISFSELCILSCVIKSNAIEISASSSLSHVIDAECTVHIK